MKLPGDIIYEIFRALPYLAQTRFASTCQQFWAIWKGKFAPYLQTKEEVIYINNANLAGNGWIAKKYYLSGLSDILFMIDGFGWQDMQNVQSAQMCNNIKYFEKESIFISYRGIVYILKFESDYWNYKLKMNGEFYQTELLIIEYQIGKMWVQSQVRYIGTEITGYRAIIDDGPIESEIMNLAPILELILRHIKMDNNLDKAQKIIRAEQHYDLDKLPFFWAPKLNLNPGFNHVRHTVFAR